MLRGILFKNGILSGSAYSGTIRTGICAINWWMFHFTSEKGRIFMGLVYSWVKKMQVESHARVGLKSYIEMEPAPVARSCDPFLDYLIQSQTRKLSLFDGVFSE